MSLKGPSLQKEKAEVSKIKCVCFVPSLIPFLWTEISDEVIATFKTRMQNEALGNAKTIEAVDSAKDANHALK